MTADGEPSTNYMKERKKYGYSGYSKTGKLVEHLFNEIKTVNLISYENRQLRTDNSTLILTNITIHNITLFTVKFKKMMFTVCFKTLETMGIYFFFYDVWHIIKYYWKSI